MREILLIKCHLLLLLQPHVRSKLSSSTLTVLLILHAPLSGTMLWYDHSQPAHPRLHQTHVSPVLETGSTPRTLRPLIHSLRALKSPAEVALMQEAGHITAQVITNYCVSAPLELSY